MRLPNRAGYRDGAAALALFALNFYIAHELFWIEYLRHMGSIEGAFIGIARYAMHHWRDLTWFPLWYGGIPYQNTYPPLLHLSVAALATVSGMTAAHSYHFVTALAYCLGPVSLFALALRWSGSRWTAFAAGLIYSTLSFSAWILPAIRADLGSALYPRRLQALALYGEGPHVTSLMLLPLALLAIDFAVERRRSPYLLLASVAVATVALTNWFGAVSLAVAIGCYLLAKAGAKNSMGSAVLWTALIGACAYLLAMPWVPPSTILVTQVNAKTVEGLFLNVFTALPARAAAIAAALVAVKFALRRLAFGLQFAILFAFAMGVVTIVAVLWQFHILPQAWRYQLEMEMAFALTIALAGQALLKRRRAATIALVVLVAALVIPIRRDRNYARNFLLRTIDITSTTEWKTSQWYNQHWSGERVMAAGSTQFWLTAFSDVPELAGGYDPGRLEMANAIAMYELYSDDGAQGHETKYSLLWLKALGVQAAGVTGPGSGEFFHPFKNWQKYEGALPVLWRDGDNVIYRVGRPNMALARVVPRGALVSKAPENGIDVDPLRAYVAALDDASMPLASFEWTSAHSAKIHATLAEGQVISVQEAWHRGWRANVPVSHDALGQMVLDPGRGGKFDIDLVYHGGTEMKVARVLSGSTAIVLALFALRGILKTSW